MIRPIFQLSKKERRRLMPRRRLRLMKRKRKKMLRLPLKRLLLAARLKSMQPTRL
jgi:hypothetical protein